MKIVCDACAAKYSIADDKVKGKVFKIRCKKCSNIIVVRGTAGVVEEPAVGPYDQKETRVYDYGNQDAGAPAPADDAVWHVVIDQEQVGPITVADVQARFANNELDAESYVWREGFTDWLPLSQVPDFAALVTAGGPAPAQPSSGSDAVASMFGSAASFAEPAAPPRAEAGDVFAAHAAKVAAVADDGGDLFGDVAPAAPEVGGFGGGRAVAQGTPAATAAGMRGQRSENSVLFSLNNLAAMASDSGRSAPASSSSSSGSAQHGGGEGSGLIDIRSMASSYLGGKAAPVRSSSSVGSVDDLPVFSTATFHEPAVIMPALGGARNNKTLYILLGAVGLLAAVAVILVVVMMSKDKGTNNTAANVGKGPGTAAGGDVIATGPGSATQPPAIPPGGGPAPGSAATGDLPPAGGSAAGSAATGALPPAGGSATEPPATTPDKPTKPERTTTAPEKPTKPERTTPDKPTKPERTTTPPEKPTKPERTTGGCIDEVACLLADPKPACCLKKTTRTTTTPTTPPPPPVNTSLPEQLDKSAISDGIAKIRARVDACASKSPAKGTVKVSVKVSGGGTVASVTVKESPDGALGSCVAAAVQKATFVKTQTGATFSYPFKF